MPQIIAGAMGALLFVFIVFFAVVFGTLFGAVGGWIVGLFFADTLLSTLARMGMNTNGLLMWQLGATLGFLGGFFRGTMRISK